MREELFNQLIDRYLDGTATPAERQLIEEYYERLAAGTGAESEANDTTPARRRILPMPYSWKAWTAAAILIVVATVGYFWAASRQQKGMVKTVQRRSSPPQDLVPGGNKAVLTLANGSSIVLDTAKNGEMTHQGNSDVVKLGDGRLVYKKGEPDKSNAVSVGPKDLPAVAYNTLATPKGGQYMITLSDGSKVWLNAASSLRYPTSFEGKERVVEITGEAYCEVQKNNAMPFVVKVNGAEIRVLGTEFNVMAYQDESDLLTTLVRGAVMIKKGNASEILKPGEQASLHSSGEISVDKDADVDQALAWKNNLFSFDDADIHAVMREIGRWYDVDVRYDGNFSQHYNGNISRAVNVSKVFRMLELTGSVHFRVEGRQIVVTN